MNIVWNMTIDNEDPYDPPCVELRGVLPPDQWDNAAAGLPLTDPILAAEPGDKTVYVVRRARCVALNRTTGYALLLGINWGAVRG